MAAASEPRHATVDRREIEAELIGGLYRRTKPLLIANLGALALLTAALWSTADRIHLLGWAVLLAGWTMLRFALARLYLRKPRPIGEARRWTWAFSVGSGVAGDLEDAPLIPGNQRLEHFLPPGPERGQGAGLVAFHEAAEAGATSAARIAARRRWARSSAMDQLPSQKAAFEILGKPRRFVYRA